MDFPNFIGGFGKSQSPNSDAEDTTNLFVEEVSGNGKNRYILIKRPGYKSFVNLEPSLLIISGCPVGPINPPFTPFSFQMTATGGTLPYTWSISAGALPPGLTINPATGLISGTPTLPGTYHYTVHVHSADGQDAEISCTLVVNGVVITSGCPIGPIVANVPFSTFTLTATGGSTPYTWSISAGALPTGLSLNSSTGQITGTPTTGGTYNFTPHVHTADGFDADIPGGCSLVVSSSMIARPTYIEMVNGPGQPDVNPAKSMWFNGPLVGDADNDTYAEGQCYETGPLASNYASLQISQWRPLPPLTPTSIVVHLIVEVIPATGSVDQPIAEVDIMNIENKEVYSTSGGIVGGFYGGIPSSKTEITHTFNPSEWATHFSSNPDNLWLRCFQFESLALGPFTTPKLLRPYEAWLEYFF